MRRLAIVNIGGQAAIAATPGVAFASAYAEGTVFIMHVEGEVARVSAQSVEAESEPA